MAITFCLNSKYRDITPILAKGHLEPRAHNLPRRRKASGRTIRKVSETTVKEAGSSLGRQTADAHRIVEQDETCLQELVPNLFVAFTDEHGDNQNSPRKGMPNQPFTHFVRISSRSRKPQSEDTIERTCDEDGAKILYLTVPKNNDDDGQTILTQPQLLAARDFLSQAMPLHYHLPHSSGKYPIVRILISISNKRAVDAMSVVACYLAFLSGRTPPTVLEHINDEEDFLGTWRGVVSRDGIDLLMEYTA